MYRYKKVLLEDEEDPEEKRVPECVSNRTDVGTAYKSKHTIRR